MTWKQFKEAVEKLGVEDKMKIVCIDVRPDYDGNVHLTADTTNGMVLILGC